MTELAATDTARRARRACRARRTGCTLTAVGSALALAGCMSFIPAYERPAAPVAAVYAAELMPSAAAAADGVATADLEWQRFFADARLRRLIEIALVNNRDLRVAVLNIEQARAAYQIRRADELPTLGAGVNAQRQPGANGALVSSVAVGLQVTGYELDFFGRVRSLSQAAQAQYLATDAARQTVQIALIAALATTHISLLADDELLRVTRETLKSREDSWRLMKLKFDNGAASALDFAQAEQLLEGARATLAQQQRQRLLDTNALELLTGQAVPSDISSGGSNALPDALPLAAQQGVRDLPAGLPSELLTRRPDVRAAEQLLLAANANIGAARAAFFPRIALTANAGSASTALSGLFKSGSFALTGSANLLLPIFDAGRNRANLEVAKVNKEIAIAQYEKAIQSAFRDVADALAGRATLGEQLRAQTAQTNAAQRTFALADLRYRNGASSYLEVLDAQRTLFAAQQATVQLQALQVQNQISLYKALGGGWKD